MLYFLKYQIMNICIDLVGSKFIETRENVRHYVNQHCTLCHVDCMKRVEVPWLLQVCTSSSGKE